MVFALTSLAQSNPVVGTDTTRRRGVTVVNSRISPPATDAATARAQALAEMRTLLEEANAVQKELQTSEAEKLSADLFKRLDRIRRSLKKVDSALKGS